MKMISIGISFAQVPLLGRIFFLSFLIIAPFWELSLIVFINFHEFLATFAGFRSNREYVSAGLLKCLYPNSFVFPRFPDEVEDVPSCLIS